MSSACIAYGIILGSRPNCDELLSRPGRAHELFERQEPAEKRRPLNFPLSNCVWKAGVLTTEYRQPRDMLALAREAAGDAVREDAAKTGRLENWLPSMYSSSD